MSGAAPDGSQRSPLTSPLLARQGAVAGEGDDAGVAWHYGDPVAEQRALEDGRGVVDLSSVVALIRVGGPDRLSWLHSITSQSLTSLRQGESTELLVLSPQGHIEHAAGVVDDGSATWLYVPQRNAADLAGWLTRMQFTLRVDVSDLTEEFAVIGEPTRAPLAGPVPAWVDPWPVTGEGATRYGPADDAHPGAQRPWRLRAVPRGQLAAEIASLEGDGVRLAGTWAAEALRVAAWRPRLESEVDHRSLPHELDWLRTSVHLHKGCYRGQEAVARVHNLGRPPRRLVMLHLDGSENVLPGPGDVVRDGEREVGVVTSAVRHHELGPIALAVIRRSVAPDAPVTVTAGDVLVAAAQEVIVPSDGESVDRPERHGPVATGLGRHGSIAAGPGSL